MEVKHVMGKVFSHFSPLTTHLKKKVATYVATISFALANAKSM